MYAEICSLSSSISIRAPAKGATSQTLDVLTTILFQSALPRRERRKYTAICFLCCNFNPRSREGSDCKSEVRRVAIFRFQSALPRRERLKRNKGFETKPYISIRAPAKGATILVIVLELMPLQISIRAPAKGATFDSFRSGATEKFQSALPRRERRLFILQSLIALLFQSALPRRERHRMLDRQIRGLVISIRAPAKGATTYQRTVTNKVTISIRAPAKGATYYIKHRQFDYYISIRAPAKGATMIRLVDNIMMIFQSALPRRERHKQATQL